MLRSLTLQITCRANSGSDQKKEKPGYYTMKKNTLILIVIGVAAVTVLSLLLMKPGDVSKKELLADNQQETATQDTVESPVPNIEYGLQTDSFSVFKGTIKRNQFLADILLGYNITYPEIDAMVKSAGDIFDVRKIKSGGNYAVYCSNDSLGKAKCFVYETNPTEYVVFDLRDSISVYKGEKEVTVKRNEASGIITSSLFNALTDNDLSPVLAMELSEIYAWTIDFYRIQKGDYFKIIFDEHYVEDEFIGIGKIHASQFNHSGNDFFAFHYEEGEHPDYFDERGESLRKAFLQSPVKFGRISSGYTMRRFHPVQKRNKPHLGTDYAAPAGTPILSTGDGVVTHAQFAKYNGNYVKVRHNSTYTTQYLHMSKIKPGIKPGKKVRQGEVIGYVGSTGLATGPHVCYRFWKNGSQVNHRKEKLPPSKPVDRDLRDDFMDFSGKLKKQLEQIILEPETDKTELS